MGRQACGVLRRDVKPENIVLEGGTASGRVFLVDFGGVQVRIMGRPYKNYLSQINVFVLPCCANALHKRRHDVRGPTCTWLYVNILKGV